MTEPQDGREARPAPEPQDDTRVPTGAEDPGELRQEIAQTRAEMSETIDAIQEELKPENLRHEAAMALRQEATERVDRLIGEVTLRASRAGSAAAEVAQQVTREARERVDAVRVLVTGTTPTETGEQTRQEAHTAATRLRQWVRDDPRQFAAVLAVVVASVVVIVRAPRNRTEARVRALQRRARD